jgi:hypothetical protein
MAKNQVIGQARVKIDGDLIETGGDVSLDLGGVKRDNVDGDYQAGAYRESQVPSKLEFSQLVKAGTFLESFSGATVTVEFDTGQSYVIRNAWSMDPATITASDGKAKRTMSGPPAEQVS